MQSAAHEMQTARYESMHTAIRIPNLQGGENCMLDVRADMYDGLRLRLIPNRSELPYLGLVLRNPCLQFIAWKLVSETGYDSGPDSCSQHDIPSKIAT